MADHRYGFAANNQTACELEACIRRLFRPSVETVIRSVLAQAPDGQPAAATSAAVVDELVKRHGHDIVVDVTTLLLKALRTEARNNGGIVRRTRLTHLLPPAPSAEHDLERQLKTPPWFTAAEAMRVYAAVSFSVPGREVLPAPITDLLALEGIKVV